MVRKKTILLIVILANLFVGCSLKNDELISKILVNEKEVLMNFEGMSWLTRDKMRYLTVYKNEEKNIYSFEKTRNRNGVDLLLKNESEDFELAELERFKASLKLDISQFAMELLDFIDSLEINGFTTEFSRFGINLTIYIDDQVQLWYVENDENVVNSEWKKALEESRALNKNWFVHRAW